MSGARWPAGVIVGHTSEGHVNGNTLVILDCPRCVLTPDEARLVASELVRRADMQDFKMESR